MLVWGFATGGWGVGQTQVSIDGGHTWLDAQTGAGALCPRAAKAHPANRAGELWAVAVTAPNGGLALRSRAVHRAGNVEALKAPVRVQSATTPGEKSYSLFFPYVARNAMRPGTR